MSQSHKTNFKVTLNLDITLDETGLRPDVIVRNIGVTERRQPSFHCSDEEPEDVE